MNKRKERASKQLRIYPKTYEKLRLLAFKQRKPMAAVIDELLK